MKKILIMAFALLSVTISAQMFNGVALAACPGSSTPKGQVIEGIQSSGGDCKEDGVDNILATIVSIMSIIVGAVAIIMIIISGLRYITAAGDSGKVTSAKNTLIYALIGVAVAALAQFLVHFVFTVSTNATDAPPATSKSCPAGNHRSSDGKKCIKN